MTRCCLIVLSLLLALAFAATSAEDDEKKPRKTRVAIKGEQFLVNGQPTYKGRKWKGHRIEGLLFNSRMVQGIFDDLEDGTRARWAYPDTKKWDADRNTREFVAAMPT